jgi:hypothetical protein
MIQQVNLISMILKAPRSYLDAQPIEREIMASYRQGAVVRVDETHEVRLGVVLGDAYIIRQRGEGGADGVFNVNDNAHCDETLAASEPRLGKTKHRWFS